MKQSSKTPVSFTDTQRPPELTPPSEAYEKEPPEMPDEEMKKEQMAQAQLQMRLGMAYNKSHGTRPRYRSISPFTTVKQTNNTGQKE